MAGIPLFYQDLVHIWAKLKSKTIPATASDICAEFIWYNNCITINGKPVFFKAWYANCIKFIQDIFGPDGYLLPENVIKSTLNVEFNFMDYYSLRHAIPKLWKNILIKERGCTIHIDQPHFENTGISSLVNRDFYWKLLEIPNKIKQTEKWNELYDINCTN